MRAIVAVAAFLVFSSVAQAGAIYGNNSKDGIEWVTIIIGGDVTNDQLCAQAWDIRFPYHTLQFSLRNPQDAAAVYFIGTIKDFQPDAPRQSGGRAFGGLTPADSTETAEAINGAVWIREGINKQHKPLVGEVAMQFSDIRLHEYVGGFEASHCASLEGDSQL